MQCHRAARRAVAACVAVAAVALAPSAASAAPPDQVADSVAAGAAWLRTQQNPATGQLTGFGGDYAVSALAAAGVHAADVRGPGATDPSVQDHYAGVWAALTAPSSTAILFGHAGGIDVQRLSASTNLVAGLAAFYNRSGDLEGSFANGATNTTAFSTLALARVGAPAAVLAKLNAYLRGQQHIDGGWNFGRVATDAQRAAAGSVDMTGAALAALCETGAGANDPDVRAGLSFLEGRQDPATGAFGNVDSTGWAVSGLNACGIDPQGGRFTTAAGLTPADFLLSQQDAGGAFLFSGAPNLYSTQNAVRALAGEAFSADPPRRLVAADPRLRPVPAVADGTATPHALALDDGAGDVRLCNVTAPAGGSLATLLAAAPADCVGSFVSGGGQLTAVNGRAGAWRVRLDRGPERPAGDAQVVAFGDTVALRLPASGTAPALPGIAGEPGPAGPAGLDGAAGPAGPRGARGRTGRATCRVRSKRRVTCRVTGSSRARLTRGGRVYAAGTPSRLRARRTIRPGRYTLRLGRARDCGDGALGTNVNCGWVGRRGSAGRRPWRGIGMRRKRATRRDGAFRRMAERRQALRHRPAGPSPPYPAQLPFVTATPARGEIASGAQRSRSPAVGRDSAGSATRPACNAGRSPSRPRPRPRGRRGSPRRGRSSRGGRCARPRRRRGRRAAGRSSPSARGRRRRAASSSVPIASTASATWCRTPSTTARARSARVVPRLSPSRVPRAPASQLGLPRPCSAGTQTGPGRDARSRASSSFPGGSAPRRANQSTAAPAVGTKPSSA